MVKPETKLDPSGDRLQPGDVDNLAPDYQDWKARKIRRALAQSEDRAQMTPADKVWESLEE